MSKEIEFKNRDRFVQLGIAISALRKMRGLSQEQLAEKRMSAAPTSVQSKPLELLARFPWKFSLTSRMRWK